MPPRLSKRQQRELDELNELQAATAIQNTSDEEEDDDIVEPAPKSVTPAFAALMASDIPELEDEASEDDEPAAPSKSKKKKRKKKSSLIPAGSSTPTRPTAKQKGKAAGESKDVDQALRELSIKYPELNAVSEASTSSIAKTSLERERSESLATLLAVSYSHLDPEAEMRKFFGSKVVGASKTKKQHGSARSNLTRPLPNWPVAIREGLSSRAMTPSEVEEARDNASSFDKYWTVEYSKRYKTVTKAFMKAVAAGDPELFWRLLGKLQWHGESLLQLADVYRHQEEYAQAVDFMDRTIFAYERGFLGGLNLSTGSHRLNFKYVENRTFYLAVHRQAIDLQRRGCFRTAFEFARMLLALDPYDDPHGAYLHLDYLAVKADMGKWLLEMWDLSNLQEGDDLLSQIHPSVLPGWAYSRALVLKMQAKSAEARAESKKALQEAVESFPAVVPLLADKADISISSDVRAREVFRVYVDGSCQISGEDHRYHVLSHIYALRAGPIWKIEEYAQWFRETVGSMPSFTPLASKNAPLRKRFQASIPRGSIAEQRLEESIQRHISVLQDSQPTLRRLLAFLPIADQDRGLASDPLPPRGKGTTRYDEAFFEGVSEDLFAYRPPTRGEERVLARMIPDAGIREQLRAIFDANPTLRERFPGVLQFAMAAAQMGDEQFEAMLLGAALNAGDGDGAFGGGAGAMPGGFDNAVGEIVDEEVHLEHLHPERHDSDDEYEVEPLGDLTDDEDEDVDAVEPGVFRRLINRFWWGGAVPEENSDEDEQDGADVDVDDANGVD